jgi:hypothetical protein
MPFEARGQGIHNNPNNNITVEGLQPDMVLDDDLEFGDYYDVLHDIGIALGGVPNPVSHVRRPGEILKTADFGLDEKEQKTVIERLLRLGAIKATKAPKSEKAKREAKA